MLFTSIKNDYNIHKFSFSRYTNVVINSQRTKNQKQPSNPNFTILYQFEVIYSYKHVTALSHGEKAN